MARLSLYFLAFAFLWSTARAAEQRNLVVQTPGTEKRVALVIGNGNYLSGAKLSNPANDARDIAASLRELGFQVIAKTDITQKEMNRAIIEFGSKLTADTIALFYFAGHGLQVRGKNYLLPVDAQIAAEAAVRAEGVDVDTVLDQLGVSPLNIVILDACRNNPFERKFRSLGGGLAQIDAPKGTLIAYATAPGRTAADGNGRNGLYTQELLKAIKTPGLSVEQVFKRVRSGVTRASSDQQTPWESSSLTGEFYFFGGTQAAQLGGGIGVGSGRSAAQIEDELWDAIKASDKVSVLEEYIVQYPKGRYVAQAKVRVTGLKNTAATPDSSGHVQKNWKLINYEVTPWPAKVRAGEPLIIRGSISVASENSRVEIDEAINVLHNERTIASAKKRANEKNEGGMFETEWKIKLPSGVPQGEYIVRTELYLNGEITAKRQVKVWVE